MQLLALHLPQHRALLLLPQRRRPLLLPTPRESQLVTSIPITSMRCCVHEVMSSGLRVVGTMRLQQLQLDLQELILLLCICKITLIISQTCVSYYFNVLMKMQISENRTSLFRKSDSPMDHIQISCSFRFQ